MKQIKKVSLLSAIIIGILAGILTVTGFAYGASKTIFNDNKGISLQDLAEIINLKKIVENMYYEDTSDVDFATGMKKGIAESLADPYSRYMTLEEYEKDLEETNGSFEGIGVYIAPGEDGSIVIIAPIKNSPADKAGIKAGDKILKVSGKSFTAKTMQEAVKLMRGEKGTNVEIEIFSSESKKIKTVSIVRDKIEQQSVYSKMLDNNIGYMPIISFDEDTAKEFRENFNELKKNNLKGLIIDLRNNPGGILEQVIDIADQILPESTIVYTNNKKNEKQVFSADNKEEIKLPIVVLVNGYSASASEILSGALQDNKKAIIVGENTYGKGLVQSFFKINDKDALSITIAQYFTPNGNKVNKVGIKPDYEVKLNENNKKIDNQLEKAIEVLSKNINENK